MSKNATRKPEVVIYTCCGSKCKKRGSKSLYKEFKSNIKEHHLKSSVQSIKTGCTDRCKFGPVVCLMPQNEWFLEVDEEKQKMIFEKVMMEVKP